MFIPVRTEGQEEEASEGWGRRSTRSRQSSGSSILMWMEATRLWGTFCRAHRQGKLRLLPVALLVMTLWRGFQLSFGRLCTLMSMSCFIIHDVAGAG